MGSSQNLSIRCRNKTYNQKGPIILRTAQMTLTSSAKKLGRNMKTGIEQCDGNVLGSGFKV